MQGREPKHAGALPACVVVNVGLRLERERGTDRAVRRDKAEAEHVFSAIQPAEKCSPNHFENHTPALAHENAAELRDVIVTEVVLLIVSCAAGDTAELFVGFG